MPDAAHQCLVQAVPRIAGQLDFIAVKQVRGGLQWLQGQGWEGKALQAALGVRLARCCAVLPPCNNTECTTAVCVLLEV